MDDLRTIATQLVGGTVHRLAACAILALVLLALLVLGDHHDDDDDEAASVNRTVR